MGCKGLCPTLVASASSAAMAAGDALGPRLSILLPMFGTGAGPAGALGGSGDGLLFLPLPPDQFHMLPPLLPDSTLAMGACSKGPKQTCTGHDTTLAM